MIKLITFAALLVTAYAAPQAAPAAAAAKSSDAVAETKKSSDQINADGSFAYQFDTSNGINIQESGSINGTVKGAVQYQSPEGEKIQLTYTADENGYHPLGAHLPTPPPVPESIVRSLEYIKAHPHPEEVTKVPKAS